MRIYVNEEEDEAIWALREYNIGNDNKKKKKKHKRSDDSDYSSSDEEEDHRDYYIVLASAKDEVPPECAWEAVDPHGLWPAAGLQYYDVKVVSPSKPKIVRTQPNPNAVQIRFECDEEGRKPKVCPHMEVWYEIEMRHFKYNAEKGKTSKKPHDTKIWKTQESPFVANRLINGDDYQFIVRSCNHIASTNSDLSARVTPLQLPPKPKIIDITGKPGELYIHFHCPNAKDREVQAKFEIIIDPPIDEQHQDYKIKEHRLLIDNDNKPVRLRNLINGTKYQIIVASVNTVGVTYSEPESAYPSKEPPQPILKKVEPGNREIVVHFNCEGYDKPDIKAWFEIELDPPAPSIDQAGILVKSDGMVDDEKKESRGHERQKSRMRTKLARKSRWRRQTMSQKLLMGGGNSMGSMTQIGGMSQMQGAMSVPNAGRRNNATNLGGLGSINLSPIDDEKSGIGGKSLAELAEIDAEDFIPYFRRNIRHKGTPIRITPVVNGIPYIVRVKAVTLSGSKISAFSEAITPKGPPPIPKINKLLPLQSSVQIEFVCNDYATEEYKAKFDIESFPQTMTQKSIKESPYIFPKLNNGRAYKFHVRGVNKEGKSKWSEVSAPVTPLKIPPKPIELRCVAYDTEITVFWVCEELKTPEYSGWYEVESDPPTFTMVVTRSQARFRRLTNGKKYKFTVTAVNQVGKSTSDVSDACMPDDEITKESYLRKKKYIACEMKEILLKIRKEQKKQKANNELVRLKKARTAQKQKNKKENKQTYNKIIAKQEKKKRQQAKKKKKEEEERKAKKKKMDEQRQRVMQNKRRMSFLAKERINNMNNQFGGRQRGKNMNTASSMMGGKKKKKKGMFGASKGKSTKKSTNGVKSTDKKPKTSGKAAPLLDMNEIAKLNALREKDEKRASKKKSKNGKGLKLDASGTSSSNSSRNSSPRKSNGKKRKKKTSKVEATVD